VLDLKQEVIMSWSKLGNIFSGHHAQVPVIDIQEDRWRIFYSTRIEGKSHPYYVEVCRYNPSIIITQPTRVNVELGDRGSFDWAGIMPTALVDIDQMTKYLYYIGWSVRSDVPYHNNLGLMISKDAGKTYQKFSRGPVLSTSWREPGYVGTISILHNRKRNLYVGWYLSCERWVEDDGKYEPIYNIKYATSLDGIDWIPTGNICIDLDHNKDEGGLSQASVIKDGEEYLMWFSSRKTKDFRQNPANSYRILSARSSDGINWSRDTGISLDVSHTGWDSLMVEYPCVFSDRGNRYMLYNGNGFGNTGIGLAIWI